VKGKSTAPAKTGVSKAPAKAGAKSGVKKRKVVPRNVKRLLTHRSTRPLWAKIKRSAKKKGVKPESLLKKTPKFVVKKIAGDKNGGKRLVLKSKGKKFYPTEDAPKRRRTGHVTYKMHKRSLKKGLEPGRILIVLAGRHRGKRVVFLKQLASGLLLVTGPFKVNACPLRRMHQNFVIVTSAKLDVSKVKIPAHVDDKYFNVKKDRSAKGKKGDGGDIFETKAEGYKPDEQRKKDQIEVDKQLIGVIRKLPDKKLMFGYLGSFFQLRNRMHPHLMQF